MIGFYFAGKYSGDYNVYWTPKNNGWFGAEDFEVIEEESSSLPGGYYLGNKAKIRTLPMECFFDGITQEQKRKLLDWLSKDSKGEQVTEDRPLVAYDVRVKNRVVITEYTQGELISGTFTINFVAYNPYGRLLDTPYYKDAEAMGDVGYDILPDDMKPPMPEQTDRQILIYNPGEVTVPLNIQLMGYTTDGDMVFTNQSNGSVCKMTGLTEGILPTGSYFDVDAENMTTYIRGGVQQENGCAYHDMGYITLRPDKMLAEDVVITTTSGSNAIVGSTGTFTADMERAYIFLEGEWRLILSVEDMEHATIFGVCGQTADTWTKIVTMNVINITADSETTFTKLDIEYTPRVR